MVVAAEQGLNSRLDDVRGRIAAAAKRSGRDPNDITLVAVSKTHPASVVQVAIELGLKDFGENRVQEAEAKVIEVGQDAARWHLIGHLQANKARRAVKLFDVIHSVDSVSLAQRLERSCVEEDRQQLQVFLQVDLAGEANKSGVAVSNLSELATAVNDCARLKLIGLMVLPPFFDESESARPFFRRLRELRDELQDKGQFGAKFGELSMGMTHDFEVAIAEGATMLRIGTAIFGERERFNR